MPHDVFALQLHHGDSLNAFELVHRIDQPAGNILWQIDLCRITGDDHLAVVAQPSQKHEHLGASGILSFVKDDNAFIKCAPAHEGQRNYFDDVVDHKPFYLLEIHHVVQRIEQGTKIRIDFGLKIAGQK